jgi:uncharacterized phage protein (TIGR01671 family)
MMRGLQLRDKNGREIFEGDEVAVAMWNGDSFKGRVHYDKANACWAIGSRWICNLGRDKGTTLEVIDNMEGAKPVKSRRKGKPG